MSEAVFDDGSIFDVHEPIPQMNYEQAMVTYTNVLENNISDRNTATALAAEIFEQLKQNQFHPLVADRTQPTPCTMKNSSSDIDAWYIGRPNVELAEQWEELKETTPEIQTWNDLDEEIEEHRSYMIEYNKLEIERSEAMLKCMNECPIAKQCLAESVTTRSERGADHYEEFGIWGGYDDDSRRRIHERVRAMKKQHIDDLTKMGIEFIDPYKASYSNVDEVEDDEIGEETAEPVQEIQIPETVETETDEFGEASEIDLDAAAEAFLSGATPDDLDDLEDIR